MCGFASIIKNQFRTQILVYIPDSTVASIKYAPFDNAGEMVTLVAPTCCVKSCRPAISYIDIVCMISGH
jgi:hypothetical protein